MDGQWKHRMQRALGEGSGSKLGPRFAVRDWEVFSEARELNLDR